jgi:hypothetical protein
MKIGLEHEFDEELSNIFYFYLLSVQPPRRKCKMHSHLEETFILVWSCHGCQH